MIGSFLIAAEIAFQQIGEKDEPENGKHDKKFNQDDPPELPPPGHPSEAIIIEIEYFSEH